MDEVKPSGDFEQAASLLHALWIRPTELALQNAWIAILSLLRGLGFHIGRTHKHLKSWDPREDSVKCIHQQN